MELYVLVEPQPLWADAVNEGLFNCPDAGGWLRQLPAGALLIEDREATVVRMLPWLEFTVGLVTQGRCPDLPKMAETLLAAALNEGEG